MIWWGETDEPFWQQRKIRAGDLENDINQSSGITEQVNTRKVKDKFSPIPGRNRNIIAGWLGRRAMDPKEG
jgi:hypothetical protein